MTISVLDTEDKADTDPQALSIKYFTSLRGGFSLEEGRKELRDCAKSGIG